MSGWTTSTASVPQHKQKPGETEQPLTHPDLPVGVANF